MKMSIRKRCLAFIAGAMMLSTPAFAVDQAASVNELIKMIQQARVSESQEHKQREAEFVKNQGNQQALLAQAKAAMGREETRSDQLEDAFDANDLRIDALRKQLDERLGSLKELFGHLTSTAGDVRANLNQSIVSAELSDRTEFLDDLIAKMSSDTRLPSMAEIERLWAEMSREMAESGKVVKFPATVIKADGEQAQQEVVRIGVFNLVSEGQYLDYNPRTGLIAELPRQPSGTSGAANLQNATSGFIGVGIDPSGPSGGNLLKALVDSPTLVEKFHEGGIVGYIITAAGLFGLAIGLWRLVYLAGVTSKVSAQLKDTNSPKENNPLGRVLKVGKDNDKLDTETLELKLNEAVLKELPALEVGHNVIKIIAALGPLLGLLGTVTGMIITFQQITIFGAGDPKAMAGGISQALVTTVQGLCIAIPMVLLHTLVHGRAQRVIHILEEQSAGIVAENAEG